MWPGGLRQQRVDSSTRHDLPPTSICIRPTDRPIYASRPRLVRGPALSSLPPSLNRYIPPRPGRDENLQKTRPIYQHSLRCKLMLARVLGVDMQRGSMPCAS